MSHVSSINLHIKDLAALRAACHELGLTFLENKKSFEWYGHWVDDYSAQDAAYRNGIKPEDYGKCAHAIKIPGTTYEIGVVNNPKGPGLTLVYDFWGPGETIKQTLGIGLEKLKQIYSTHAATNAARKKGWTIQRTQTANGTIKLNMTVP
jgi:hypothetical protein